MTLPFGEIRNGLQERLDYSCQGSLEGPGRLVVIGHGVTANKDRSWALTLAKALEAAGVASLRFSFSGNGESEGDFRQSTVSKEVSDLGAVLDAVGAAKRSICFVGHSMGGAVGVLRAAQDPRIDLLVSLAGMVHTQSFAQVKFGELEPDRDVMWDKAECPLSTTFVEDMKAIGSVLPRASQVRVPWLLVHGTADGVVPVEEAREAAAAAPSPAQVELLVFEEADHLFSGADEPRMAAAVVDWLRSSFGDDSG
jgi:pimeloyl-ACP methyl ester carboxylesterase